MKTLSQYQPNAHDTPEICKHRINLLRSETLIQPLPVQYTNLDNLEHTFWRGSLFILWGYPGACYLNCKHRIPTCRLPLSAERIMQLILRYGGHCLTGDCACVFDTISKLQDHPRRPSCLLSILDNSLPLSSLKEVYREYRSRSSVVCRAGTLFRVLDQGEGDLPIYHPQMRIVTPLWLEICIDDAHHYNENAVYFFRPAKQALGKSLAGRTMLIVASNRRRDNKTNYRNSTDPNLWVRGLNSWGAQAFSLLQVNKDNLGDIDIVVCVGGPSAIHRVVRNSTNENDSLVIETLLRGGIPFVRITWLDDSFRTGAIIPISGYTINREIVSGDSSHANSSESNTPLNESDNEDSKSPVTAYSEMGSRNENPAILIQPTTIVLHTLLAIFNMFCVELKLDTVFENRWHAGLTPSEKRRSPLKPCFISTNSHPLTLVATFDEWKESQRLSKNLSQTMKTIIANKLFTGSEISKIELPSSQSFQCTSTPSRCSSSYAVYSEKNSRLSTQNCNTTQTYATSNFTESLRRSRTSISPTSSYGGMPNLLLSKQHLGKASVSRLTTTAGTGFGTVSGSAPDRAASSQKRERRPNTRPSICRRNSVFEPIPNIATAPYPYNTINSMRDGERVTGSSASPHSNVTALQQSLYVSDSAITLLVATARLLLAQLNANADNIPVLNGAKWFRTNACSNCTDFKDWWSSSGLDVFVFNQDVYRITNILRDEEEIFSVECLYTFVQNTLQFAGEIFVHWLTATKKIEVSSTELSMLCKVLSPDPKQEPAISSSQDVLDIELKNHAFSNTQDIFTHDPFIQHRTLMSKLEGKYDCIEY